MVRVTDSEGVLVTGASASAEIRHSSFRTLFQFKHGAKIPPPLKYSREEMDSWIARDEADMEEFRHGE
jgi:hypothetical protein